MTLMTTISIPNPRPGRTAVTKMTPPGQTAITLYGFSQIDQTGVATSPSQLTLYDKTLQVVYASPVNLDYGNFRCLLVDANMRAFLAQNTGLHTLQYSLQTIGSIPWTGSLQYDGSAQYNNCHHGIILENTETAILATNTQVWRYSLADYSSTPRQDYYPGADPVSFVYALYQLKRADTILSSVSLVAPFPTFFLRISDLVPVVTVYFDPTSAGSTYLLDNINHEGFYYESIGTSTSPLSIVVRKYDCVNIVGNYMTLLGSVTVTTDPSYLATKQMINFGPFQYLLIMPVLGNFCYLHMIDKLSLPMQSVRVDPTSFNRMHDLAFNGFEYVPDSLGRTYLDKYYFWKTERDNLNINSFYLTVDQCLVRDPNTGVCSKCIPGAGLISMDPNNQCQMYQYFPLGLGLNAMDGMRTPCRQQGCLECSEDYNLCTLCDASKNVMLVNGACVTTRADLEPLVVSQAVYFNKQRKGLLKFSQTISVSKEFLAGYSVVIVDQVNDIQYNCSRTDCPLAISDSNQSLVLSILWAENPVVKGIILISPPSTAPHISSADIPGVIYSIYPLTIPDFTFSAMSSSLSKAAENSIKLTSAIRAPLNLLLVFSSPSSALSLDKLICDFLYLQFLSGRFLSFPDAILSNVLDVGLLPFSVGNPFGAWANHTSCSTQGTLAKNSLECSLFSNYGENLIILIGLFFLNSLASLSLFLLKRRGYNGSQSSSGEKFDKPQSFAVKDPSFNIKKIEGEGKSYSPPNPSTSLNLMSSLKRSPSKLIDKNTSEPLNSTCQSRTLKTLGTYGLQFFLLKLDGIQLELLFYSIANLSFLSSDYPVSNHSHLHHRVLHCSLLDAVLADPTDLQDHPVRPDENH